MAKKIKKRKINKVNLAALIISVIALIAITCILIGVVVLVDMLKDKPDLDINDFSSKESSLIYDAEDNLVYELGTTIRKNVEYEDLPTSVVDAFVAVEDSRFFVHNGFDVPRFTKAIIANLKTMSFGQGGSTFTMQLVKNTYFVDDEAGQGAVKSIKRKIQEIVLAFELEQEMSKKEIFTNYLNKLFFGGTYSNIRGIEKASQYYFGKSVTELNLPESAMLAGVINAPVSYNPFLHLDLAQERRDEVLYLMNYHGYITDEEYKLALQTKVEDFLYDSSKSISNTGNGIPYQAYVDQVVDEVYELTGLDPYTTPMIIHTYMNTAVQEQMDKIQAGDVNGLFEFPDDYLDVASICVDNSNGGIIAIMGGRQYANGGALLLNHATKQYKQPGSSIKPILDYSQAFEVLGWSTSHVLTDKPITYVGTDFVISNSDNKYNGEMTLQDALGNSKNTPAIQTIREIIDKKGSKYLIDYLSSIGINVNANDFDEQYGIGGKSLEVSCLQLAGAYSALISNGYYTEPHCVSKIEFLNDKMPVEPEYESTQVISEQSAYMMCSMLKENVSQSYPFYGVMRDERYDVYSKTGTTNWGTEGEQYGIKNGAIKDGWVVAGTGDYTIATWMGYEKAQKDKPSYITSAVYNTNIKGKITNLIIDKTVEEFGLPTNVSRPSGVKEITHIISTFPYAEPITNMDEKYTITGLIKNDSEYANLVSPEKANISELPSKATVTLDDTILNITWPEYPDLSQLTIAPEQMDISLKRSDGTVSIECYGTKLFDYTWIYGAVKYKADIVVNGEKVQTISSSSNKFKGDISPYVWDAEKVTIYVYYGYEYSSAMSNYQSFEFEVTDEITLDIPNTDYLGIYAYFQRFTDNIKLEATVDSSKTEGEVQYIEARSSGLLFTTTEKYYPGKQYSTTRSQLYQVTIYYYTKQKDSFALTASAKTVSPNQQVTIYCTVNSGLIWLVDGNVSNTDTSPLTVSFQTTGVHTVECIYNGKRESIEIMVN